MDSEIMKKVIDPEEVLRQTVQQSTVQIPLAELDALRVMASEVFELRAAKQELSAVQQQLRGYEELFTQIQIKRRTWGGSAELVADMEIPETVIEKLIEIQCSLGVEDAQKIQGHCEFKPVINYNAIGLDFGKEQETQQEMQQEFIEQIEGGEAKYV